MALRTLSMLEMLLHLKFNYGPYFSHANGLIITGCPIYLKPPMQRKHMQFKIYCQEDFK